MLRGDLHRVVEARHDDELVAVRLHLLGDDPYLRMQAYNLSIVDQFIMQIESELLRSWFQEEQRSPADGMFVSAQSQMWIFAAYELLRTWRERSKDVIKFVTKTTI